MASLILTKGEKLIITRRRAGKNQTEAAKDFGVHRDTYAQWEKDITNTAPDVSLTEPLKAFEACYLLRRRSNKTQKQLADALHLSRMTVNSMELGKVNYSQLSTFWGI